jgi:hypothetical protein
MARTVRDTNLETRAARLRLESRGKPFWRTIETGLHVGYRRLRQAGGTWIQEAPGSRGASLASSAIQRHLSE